MVQCLGDGVVQLSHLVVRVGQPRRLLIVAPGKHGLAMMQPVLDCLKVVVILLLGQMRWQHQLPINTNCSAGVVQPIACLVVGC